MTDTILYQSPPLMDVYGKRVERKPCRSCGSIEFYQHNPTQGPKCIECGCWEAVSVDVRTRGTGSWVTMKAVMKLENTVLTSAYLDALLIMLGVDEVDSVYVGEFSDGIQKDAAIARVVALFGDQLAWIDCTHYEGT